MSEIDEKTLIELFAEREDMYLHATDIINEYIEHVYDAIVMHFELSYEDVEWHDVVMINDDLIINGAVDENRTIVAVIPVDVACSGSVDAVIDHLLRVEMHNKKQAMLSEQLQEMVNQQHIHSAMRQRRVLH